jgi:uncharacterized NAD-dependent epimerase/dehydratase family protein
MTASTHAIVYCEGAFTTTNGKTAHGLARRSEKFHILSVVDSTCAGRIVDEILEGAMPGIPVLPSLQEALDTAKRKGTPASTLIVGLAPDGGRLPPHARADILTAIDAGLDVVCGLHDFLSEDPEVASLAERKGTRIIDVRRPPALKDLHFFSGVIDQVRSFRVAVLGTDSAVGKRTTAWMLVDGFRAAGKSADLIGTGQTAWLQGANHSVVLDSIINDFVAGELEHAVHCAWQNGHPDVLVVEGQGSLLNPAYPGGFELLAATRPHVVVLQHAPARVAYDGFPDFPLHPLAKQIAAIEMISDRPVVALAINTEDLASGEVDIVCQRIEKETGLPVVAPLKHGAKRIVDHLLARMGATTGRP